MKGQEIINKLSDWNKIAVMHANEWLDFATIMSEIESLLHISAHGAKEVKKLESLEKLIWLASKAYHEEQHDQA